LYIIKFYDYKLLKYLVFIENRFYKLCYLYIRKVSRTNVNDSRFRESLFYVNDTIISNFIKHHYEIIIMSFGQNIFKWP